MTTISRVILQSFLVGTLIAGLGFFAATEADAQRGVRARVYLVQHRVPARLTGRALEGFARRHATTRLRGADAYQVDVVAAFDRAPGNFEIAFFDLSGEQPRQIHTVAVTASGDSTTYRQSVTLRAADGFNANQRIRAVVRVGGRDAGNVRFGL